MTCLHFDILGLSRFQASAAKVEALNRWNVAPVTNQHTRSSSIAARGLPEPSPGSAMVRVFFFFLFTLIAEPINLFLGVFFVESWSIRQSLPGC